MLTVLHKPAVDGTRMAAAYSCDCCGPEILQPPRTMKRLTDKEPSQASECGCGCECGCCI